MRRQELNVCLIFKCDQWCKNVLKLAFSRFVSNSNRNSQQKVTAQYSIIAKNKQKKKEAHIYTLPKQIKSFQCSIHQYQGNFATAVGVFGTSQFSHCNRGTLPFLATVGKFSLRVKAREQPNDRGSSSLTK